jgi:hypothetical protein
MFNLIMRSVDWNTGVETVPIERMLEYTDPTIADQLRRDGNLHLERLTALPCLFMQEGIGDEIARVGQINTARIVGREVLFEYTIDPEVPLLQNRMIYANRIAVDMPHDFEFSRNHWAVKGVDLYRFLLRNVRPRRQRPSVFRIPEHENIDPALASAMMPFAAGFTPVYQCIQQAAENAGLRCRRADDIWENPSVIQDVVSLIDRSRVVVCDCSGRNPNVFYEVGIAHTLGREVILITQSADDIPFDLRHLRYISYLNNGEGRASCPWPGESPHLWPAVGPHGHFFNRRLTGEDADHTWPLMKAADWAMTTPSPAMPIFKSSGKPRLWFGLLVNRVDSWPSVAARPKWIGSPRHTSFEAPRRPSDGFYYRTFENIWVAITRY